MEILFPGVCFHRFHPFSRRFYCHISIAFKLISWMSVDECPFSLFVYLGTQYKSTTKSHDILCPQLIYYEQSKYAPCLSMPIITTMPPHSAASLQSHFVDCLLRRMSCIIALRLYHGLTGYEPKPAPLLVSRVQEIMITFCGISFPHLSVSKYPLFHPSIWSHFDHIFIVSIA